MPATYSFFEQLANNVALSKLYKTGEPETPPEDYLPSFVALLKKAVGKDGRTAATIVHRTLMKKKFRLTQPVAEYISQQDGPEQKKTWPSPSSSVAR